MESGFFDFLLLDLDPGFGFEGAFEAGAFVAALVATFLLALFFAGVFKGFFAALEDGALGGLLAIYINHS